MTPSTYTFIGPIAPDSTITAAQSTQIGQSIQDAYTAGQQAAAPAPAPAAAAPTVATFWTQNQAPIIAAAGALLLIAVARSME